MSRQFSGALDDLVHQACKKLLSSNLIKRRERILNISDVPSLLLFACRQLLGLV